jgi:hypothetical protein
MSEVTFEYEDILKETDKALLLATDAGEIWIPKSQIVDLDRENKEMTLPKWLVRDKGLE